MNNNATEIIHLIEGTSEDLRLIIDNMDEVSEYIIKSLLDKIYKLTYEIVLTNLKGVPLINSGKKSMFSELLRKGINLEEDDNRFTQTEKNIYYILYILKALDGDSYSVLFKVL